MNDFDLNGKIYVAGHRGMVGSAFCRKLKTLGARNVITKSHAELDLCNQAATESFFREERPEYVIMAAAKVGGIVANDTYPADFARENLQIQTNIIDAAYRHGCKKLLFIGSSCMYPKMCPQPIKEEYLLTGPPEPTNEAFAVAKLAGLVLSQSYGKQYGFKVVNIISSNLYGPGDNFHPQGSHVLPALLRRFHEAKRDGLAEVTIWGTGTPLREFLHVDDLADACVFLMNNYSGERHVNIGSGQEFSTLNLARLVAKTVGFHGRVLTDPSKPDGAPRKCLDASFLYGLGWKPGIDLEAGLAGVYQWYLQAEADGRLRT